LWGVDQTAELVKEAREINESLKAICVINAADPQGKDTKRCRVYVRLKAGARASFIVRRKHFPTPRRLSVGP